GVRRVYREGAGAGPEGSQDPKRGFRRRAGWRPRLGGVLSQGRHGLRELLAVPRAGGATGCGAGRGARVVTRRPPFDLQGDLRAFGVPLVFQMIGLASATGRLTLRSPRATSEVYFQEGRLVLARGPGQSCP